MHSGRHHVHLMCRVITVHGEGGRVRVVDIMSGRSNP